MAIEKTTRVITMELPAVPAADLAWLAGTHRWQHVPAAANGQRQTSYCTVHVLDSSASSPSFAAAIPRSELRIEVRRGTGPGGQHRNTAESAVRLTHLPTGLTASMNAGRSQTENLRIAASSLQEKVAARERQQAAQQVNETRRDQAADRAVAFSHNAFRGEVVCQATGRRWSARAWAQGRF